MFEYLKGEITEITPSYAVVEVNGIGYFLNISLHTYSVLEGLKEVKIYVHRIIREDTQTLYGFAEREERELFRLLLSVSGVGGSTARLMLSTLKPDEIKQAILNNDVALIKSVKGVGLKTAQRIIVDLKDKLGKSDQSIPTIEKTEQITEAIKALEMLGFSKKMSEKAVRKILKSDSKLKVEDIIREALKILSK